MIKKTSLDSRILKDNCMYLENRRYCRRFYVTASVEDEESINVITIKSKRTKER